MPQGSVGPTTVTTKQPSLYFFLSILFTFETHFTQQESIKYNDSNTM